jgi:hypothetical protein
MQDRRDDSDIIEPIRGIKEALGKKLLILTHTKRNEIVNPADY